MSRRRIKNKSPTAEPRKSGRPLSRQRLWLFRLVLLLLPFFVFGCIELLLRLGGYGYDPHLFKRLRIGNEEFFVQNEDFSLRFFPKELARHPGPLRFPVHKAPGVYRIFVLGESAAMGDPAQSFAPDRYLDMLLRSKYPDRRFEVINVAFTAINSHVILPIARECAAHEGDLWILYLGNNEMVGPFGAATVFGWQAPPLPFVRLVLALQRLRTGQWLLGVGRRWTSQGAKATAWGGMEMFTNNLIAPDSPRKETVYRNFEKNLDDIVRAGANSGAKVLLNTVAVNLKDCPPFASASARQLSAADRTASEQLRTNGIQALEQNQFAAAADFFERAVQLDPRSAELQFFWGECALASTNLAGARAHFQLACDYDALPFRADSRINDAIRAEAKKADPGSLIVLDAASALGAGSVTGVCGQETFYEHVHFDFEGRYRLGLAWARQIEPLLPPNPSAWATEAVCSQMLGLSPWNRAQVIHLMVERMRVPPLSRQPNNARRAAALEARINRLSLQMNAENVSRTRQAFRNMLEQWPEDYFLHQENAVFCELIGDLAGAGEEWQRFRDLLPHDFLGYYGAGRLLLAQNRSAEAEAALRVATVIRPSHTDAWVKLGEAHTKLGLELIAAGEPAKAGMEFSEAARLSPDSAAVRLNYGTWLQRQSRWDQAQREFEAVLRIEPGNVPARQGLNLLKLRKPPAQ